MGRSTINRYVYVLLVSSIAAAARAAPETKGPFDGEWRTSIGTVTLKQTKNDITGAYGNKNQFTIKGTVAGKKLNFEYQEDQSAGDGNWTLDDSGLSFKGSYKARGGQGGEWNGWRPDPKALEGKPVNLAGLWLTDLGLMELEQTGENIQGRFAAAGVSTIEGTITGRRFD